MFYLEVMQYHHYICTSNRLYKTTMIYLITLKKVELKLKNQRNSKQINQINQKKLSIVLYNLSKDCYHEKEY